MKTWRPLNETPEDLQREDAAAARIEAAWGLRCIKLSPALYSADWAFFEGNALAFWGEFKFRDKRYDTLLLSAAKWIAGRKLVDITGRPFLLFVEWPEGLYWYRFRNGGLPIQLGGSNRGQNGDKEPCVYIDAKKFNLLDNQQPAKE